ncbi:hypothetical protein PVAP13_7NG349334 [Panicum virgatum]|uniref:Uncharacterized protein n=1 Tax=Panicum virgatum TaxID=38727 RepID=A0A8T0PRZ6_PANVG|nr:hypothetical protein PVAP13_7NG349334 [Panicum virgatum]
MEGALPCPARALCCFADLLEGRLSPLVGAATPCTASSPCSSMD